MLTRRGWLTTLVGLFGFAGVQKGRTQTVPSEYDRNGSSVAQAYVLRGDGFYYLVDRMTLKTGDKFIMIGVDGDRLWRVAEYKAEAEAYGTHNGLTKIQTSDPLPVLLNNT